MSYGWIIDTDHMPDETKPEGTNFNAKGVVGPCDIPDWMEEALKDGAKHHVVISNGPSSRREANIYSFLIYDSDGELYYTGRMITDEGDTEEACAGPLDDFGRPNAGATEIHYPGHPEMDIG